MKNATAAQARWFLVFLLILVPFITRAWARATDYHPLMVGYLVCATLSLLSVCGVYIWAMKGRK
jgi:uncharacterized membrane protein